MVVKNKITIDDLKEVKVVRPEDAGSQWLGVSHYKLLRAIRREAKRRKWVHLNTRISLARGNADMAAVMDMTVPSIEMPDGMSLAVGVVNSNARRFAIRMSVGATVHACTNGVVIGTLVLSRMHTSRLDLADEVCGALDAYQAQARSVPEVIKALEGMAIANKAEASEIILEAARCEYIPWARLVDVDKKYRKKYVDIYGANRWSLYNSFTDVLRRTSAMQQMNRAKGLMDLMLNYN